MKHFYQSVLQLHCSPLLQLRGPFHCNTKHIHFKKLKPKVWQHFSPVNLFGARSSVMEAGHKHALEWSRNKGGFPLYGHKVKHEHLHTDTGGGCCWTSTTDNRSYTCTAENTTSTRTVEVEKDNNQARTGVETFVKSILTRFLSKSTEGRIHATSTGSAS